MRTNVSGFTLVELMLVVLIVAILSAIALPTYNGYMRKTSAAQAMQEMQKISEQLERHKSKNFSYKNFNPGFLYQNVVNGVVNVPANATGKAIKYRIYIRDADDPTLRLDQAAAVGKQWVILAESNSISNFGEPCATCNSLQQQNYSFLLTSRGTECKTKLALKAADTLTGTNLNAVSPCGGQSEDW